MRRRVELLQQRASLRRPDADSPVGAGRDEHRCLATAGGLHERVHQAVLSDMVCATSIEPERALLHMYTLHGRNGRKLRLNVDTAGLPNRADANGSHCYLRQHSSTILNRNKIIMTAPDRMVVQLGFEPSIEVQLHCTCRMPPARAVMPPACAALASHRGPPPPCAETVPVQSACLVQPACERHSSLFIRRCCTHELDAALLPCRRCS